MSRDDVKKRCTTRQLVVLKNAAGIQRGTINSRKEDLLDYLDEYVGGFRCDSGEGAGPNVTDIGLAGGRGGGVVVRTWVRATPRQVVVRWPLPVVIRRGRKNLWRRGGNTTIFYPDRL
ncbi:unnamed protein product [Pylaiella littoralis]